MKFAEHLAAHLTPEWYKQYISYEFMKKMLYKAVEEAPSPEAVDPFVIEAYFGRFSDDFFIFCDKELNKVNTFFLEKLSEATRKMASLEADLSKINSPSLKKLENLKKLNAINSIRKRYFSERLDPFSTPPSSQPHNSKKSSQNLKSAFSEFYLSLILLQNYQTLNFQGFRKICKKHDKLLKTERGSHWRQSNVEISQFYLSRKVDQMIKEVEQIYTEDLEGGNRQEAMKRLRVPPFGNKHGQWTSFRMGLFMGLFVVFSVLALYCGVLTQYFYFGNENFTGNSNNNQIFLKNHSFSSKNKNFQDTPPFPGIRSEFLFGSKVVKLSSKDSWIWEPVLQLFRGFFLIILFLFLIGINTFGWKASGVNHVLIFELDPRDHLRFDQLIEVASFLSVIWSLSLLFFITEPLPSFPRFLYPFILFLVFFCFFFNPFPVFHYKARKWFLRVLFFIVTAPFHHVSFPHFWVADQLNSLSCALLDFQFFVCFYSTEINWSSGFKLRKNHMTTDIIIDESTSIGTSVHSSSSSSSSFDHSSICSGTLYSIRPILACLPAWFRFAQCIRRYRDTRLFFPHLVNAGKYGSTFLVILFSTLYKIYFANTKDSVSTDNIFFYLWVISATLNSCYSLVWDLTMDWGFFEKKSDKGRTVLREEIIYNKKVYYYLAMVEDTVLRFSWVCVLYFDTLGTINHEVVRTTVACLEVFRRFVWNFLRLENEHLNNCGQFRAVRDIGICPVESGDEKLLIQMMDFDEGVFNRISQNSQDLKKLKENNKKELGIEVETKKQIQLCELKNKMEDKVVGITKNADFEKIQNLENETSQLLNKDRREELAFKDDYFFEKIEKKQNQKSKNIFLFHKNTFSSSSPQLFFQKNNLLRNDLEKERSKVT